MNFDESLLSDYLDDELDPDARRGVEEAVSAEPSRGERLAVMAANRALVAGLSRPPSPCSLVSGVMDRVEGSRSSRRRRPYYWLATAASLTFAVILHQVGRDASPRSVPMADTTTAPNSTEPITDLVRPVSVVEAGHEGGTAIAKADPLGPVVDQSDASRDRLIAMLDRSGTSRILIVTDVLDPAARDRVAALLRETPRKNPDFGRMTVAQGLVVDPTNPNEAEVFPVVLDDRERSQLLARLYLEFTTVIDEPVTDPTMATHLAEVGQIRVESGRAAAGLDSPPNDPAILAIRGHDLQNPFELSSNDLEVAPVPLERNDVAPKRAEAVRPRSVEPSGIASAHAGRSAIKSGPPSVVLVWVTSHQPARVRD